MWAILLIFFTFSFGASLAVASDNCVKDASPERFPGVLVGFGEGPSYADAKATATADAMSVLGTKVMATGSVVETSAIDPVYAIRSVETETKALVKGAAVLAHCVAQQGHQIVVGIQKSLVAKLIDQRAEARAAWVNSAMAILTDATTKRTPKLIRESKEAFDALIADEANDSEGWIVLGQPTAMFKRIPDADKQRLTGLLEKGSEKPSTITVSAGSDPVAKKTLPLLVQRLAADGVKAKVVSKSEGTWSCVITRGSPFGATVRFAASCELSGAGYEIDPVRINSIAPSGGVDDAAIRLVSDRLLAH